MKHKKSGYRHLLFFVVVLLAALGATTTLAYAQDPEGTPMKPDYASRRFWVHRQASPSKPVDVFFVYPTIYSGEYPCNMDLNNQRLRDIAGKYILKAYAGAYSSQANLFMPYYRQMSMAKLDPDSDIFKSPYFLIGYKDVSQAFDYYMKHFNNGRPFILAGHSQGAMQLILLMAERFKNVALQNKLVAAYLIGYSVTKQDYSKYPWFKAAQKEDDTGVIISYNTQLPGTTGSPVLRKHAVGINPLNWKTDQTPAPATLCRGAVFYNKTTYKIQQEVKGYCGAQLDTASGALLTAPPDLAGLDLNGFPPGVLHMFDYPFWYRNLEYNADVRIKAFLAGK